MSSSQPSLKTSDSAHGNTKMLLTIATLCDTVALFGACVLYLTGDVSPAVMLIAATMLIPAPVGALISARRRSR